MKTDGLFHELFLKFPGIFFELTGGSPQDALGYRFTSIEVKELAFRLDGVFVPDETSDGPIWIVEAQFHPKNDLYERLFTETLIYLRQQQPRRSWRAAVIYPTRSIERPDRYDWYGEFFESGRVQRIYLDELQPSASLGIEVVRLVVAPPEQVGDRARELVTRSQSEIQEPAIQEEFLKLVVGIMIQKLPQKNREEIEAMLGTGIDAIRHTAFYRDVAEEEGAKARAKLQSEAVPRMLAEGIAPEKIAQILDMSIEAVREIIATCEQEE